MKAAIAIALAILSTNAIATGSKPSAPASSSASASSAAAAVASGGISSAVGGAGGAGGLGGAATANVSGGDSLGIGFGAPSYGGGSILMCEAVFPILGGTYERESCAVLRDAMIAQQLNQAEIVKPLLCNLEKFRAAYAITGRPCL